VLEGFFHEAVLPPPAFVRIFRKALAQPALTLLFRATGSVRGRKCPLEAIQLDFHVSKVLIALIRTAPIGIEPERFGC